MKASTIAFSAILSFAASVFGQGEVLYLSNCGAADSSGARYYSEID